MSLIEHIAIVVPAADEERTIADCLSAIAAARRSLCQARPDITTDVILVLDRCTDGTAAVASSDASVHLMRVDARCVGIARDLGTRRALLRASGAAGDVCAEHIWTAHTDADSRVPEHWLVEQVRRAELGADLVLGTVEPDLTEPALSSWRRAHQDVDGHQHVHGASLGIRASALVVVGGWPPLRSGEDVALVRAAQQRRLRIDRPGGLAVRTSARRHGRAPGGFSSYLRALDGQLARSEDRVRA